MTVLDYIAELDRIFRRGNATEHSYRPALQALLLSHATNIQATNEPQQIAGNAPITWCGADPAAAPLFVEAVSEPAA